MDPEALTIGFARRATGYKRSTLIFSDLHRLTDISRKEKIQMIFAGKAHPNDGGGKELIKQIHGYANKLKDQSMLFTWKITIWILEPNLPLVLMSGLTLLSRLWKHRALAA